MALVNDVKKEIHAKIVYFGPAQSGKTTNLEYIYGKLKPEYRGAFKFMNTSSGKIVFFDFMRPELAGVEDYSVRFHIYTAPGEVSVPAIWKNALKGADGIVFVADADPSRMLENRRSLESLKCFLLEQGTKLGDVPCIFQCNKKDLADQSSLEQMKSLLEIDEFRMIPASARAGEAVLPTLSEMIKLILQKLRDLPAVQPEEKPAVGVESGMEFSEPVQMPETLLAETAE
ncbi:MAG: GTPase domain-containing protein, partial [Geobacteraceae bacterium]|nr:GTPase domain-containing protein [Geobacteraceae bacterium]